MEKTEKTERMASMGKMEKTERTALTEKTEKTELTVRTAGMEPTVKQHTWHMQMTDMVTGFHLFPPIPQSISEHALQRKQSSPQKRLNITGSNTERILLHPQRMKIKQRHCIFNEGGGKRYE